MKHKIQQIMYVQFPFQLVIQIILQLEIQWDRLKSLILSNKHKLQHYLGIKEELEV
jgi:hypothetical protein